MTDSRQLLIRLITDAQDTVEPGDPPNVEYVRGMASLIIRSTPILDDDDVETITRLITGDRDTRFVTGTEESPRARALRELDDERRRRQASPGSYTRSPDSPDDDPACGAETGAEFPCGWPAGHAYPHQGQDDASPVVTVDAGTRHLLDALVYNVKSAIDGDGDLIRTADRLADELSTVLWPGVQADA